MLALLVIACDGLAFGANYSDQSEPFRITAYVPNTLKVVYGIGLTIVTLIGRMAIKSIVGRTAFCLSFGPFFMVTPALSIRVPRDEFGQAVDRDA